MSDRTVAAAVPATPKLSEGGQPHEIKRVAEESTSGSEDGQRPSRRQTS